MIAGSTPAGIKGGGAPLKGTKLEAELLAAEPPVPPPVKLAPFGCDSKQVDISVEEMQKGEISIPQSAVSCQRTGKCLMYRDTVRQWDPRTVWSNWWALQTIISSELGCKKDTIKLTTETSLLTCSN